MAPTRSVFVDGTSGSDATGAGTQASPFATIGKGIERGAAIAGSAGCAGVYVSKGHYAEAVVLRSGVSVWGGYDAAAAWGWDGAANVFRPALSLSC